MTLEMSIVLFKVTGHEGPEALEECLKGAEVVVIPAGVPRKPGMPFYMSVWWNEIQICKRWGSYSVTM